MFDYYQSFQSNFRRRRHESNKIRYQPQIIRLISSLRINFKPLPMKTTSRLRRQLTRTKMKTEQKKPAFASNHTAFSLNVFLLLCL